MKRERVKRRLHIFWHKLIPPSCIECNENWKTKFENRAQVSVVCTKTRLTDTRKRTLLEKLWDEHGKRYCRSYVQNLFSPKSKESLTLSTLGAGRVGD